MIIANNFNVCLSQGIFAGLRESRSFFTFSFFINSPSREHCLFWVNPFWIIFPSNCFASIAVRLMSYKEPASCTIWHCSSRLHASVGTIQDAVSLAQQLSFLIHRLANFVQGVRFLDKINNNNNYTCFCAAIALAAQKRVLLLLLYIHLVPNISCV